MYTWRRSFLPNFPNLGNKNKFNEINKTQTLSKDIDITFYDSPNVIAGTATKFSYDNSTFCVSYIKFRFQVQIETLTFIVSLK